MCGRFTITVTFDELQEYVSKKYEIEKIETNFSVPNYNVAPSMDIISILHDGKKYRIGLLKWGFVPSFNPDDKLGFINAKAETIFEKPSFKKAVLHQRCIVLADGYYEWSQDDTKQPYRITTDQKLFAMAAVWNTVQTSDGKKLHSVAIITTKANKITEGIHERMPVILTPETEKIWLNPRYIDPNDVKSVLKPYQGTIHMYKVSKRVGSPAVNDIDLIEEM